MWSTNGELPEIFWLLFWVFVVLVCFRGAYLGGKSAHDIRMRALDILKSYAEKGTEPPPAMMEELTRQALDDRPHARKPQAHDGGMLAPFLGFLFMACVSWALHAWLESSGAPAWQPAAAIAATAFFGLGAFGILFVGLVTRNK